MTRTILSYSTLGLGGAIGSGAMLSDDQTQQIIQLISALLTMLVGALVRRYLPSRAARDASSGSDTSTGEASADASPGEALDTSDEAAPSSSEVRP